jgi:hypothetical protein
VAPKKKGKGQSIGFWQMLNNVLIASLNKGQFPLAILGCMTMMVLWKMPPADISTLVFRIVDGLEHHWLTGYLLFVAAIGCWFAHARWQRRVITREMGRVGDQRTKLQEKLLGSKLSSSEEGK